VVQIDFGSPLASRPMDESSSVVDEPESLAESLDEFAQSLSYGKRSDLTFKFLPRFAGTDVGDALASVLREVGALFDSGDPAALIDLTIDLQAAGYRSRPLNERYHYVDSPFTVPQRSVAESQVAVLTSSGHYAVGDDPRPLGVDSMSQEQAEERIGDFLKEAPVLSEVPVTAGRDELQVRHGGYDVRGSLADHNVSFPIDRLRELESDGVVGGLHDSAYSFVGACAQGRLIKEIGPQWADRLVEGGSDVALLVPV
jgi:hypothetical protein